MILMSISLVAGAEGVKMKKVGKKKQLKMQLKEERAQMRQVRKTIDTYIIKISTNNNIIVATRRIEKTTT